MSIPEHLKTTPIKDDGKTLADFMPHVTVDGTTFKAEIGEPLAADAPRASQDDIIESIRTVEDPEIPVNLYDLGLIYRHDQDADGNVDVDMTLTAPGCPVAGQMPGMVAEAVNKIDGVGKVTVTLVWDPPWTKAMMSDDAKLILGIF